METFTCSFFGHRNFDLTTTFKDKIQTIIENLISNNNVFTFLFGSRSEFNYYCHLIVSELKIKYPNIKRISYTCKHETCTLEHQLEKREKVFSHLFNEELHLLGVEEEFEHKTKYTSGKASYIERNQAMIDNSNYCIFYYNKNYLPPKRKYSKKGLNYYQPKSGTAIAFEYATQKKKNIINIYDI